MNYEEAKSLAIKYFNGDELAATTYLKKYALTTPEGDILEEIPDKMHKRMAKEFARIEAKYSNPLSEEEIYDLFKGFKRIIPQGSPMSGIGNPYQVQSLGNCFVLNPPLDSYGSICKTDQQMAQLSKRRAGVGADISNLRPNGSPTKNAAKTSTGIIPFMERFSNTIREVGQCLEGNTLILTKVGLVPISQIKINQEVWTKEGWVAVANVVKNKKALVKLTTKYGKEILCSKDHVFHTINGEKAVKDLIIGAPITQIVGKGWNSESEIILKNSSYKGSKRTSFSEKEKIRSLYSKGKSFGKLSKLFNLDKSTISYIVKNHKDKIQTANINLPEILDSNLAYILGLSYGDGCVSKSDLSFALSTDWSGITEKLADYTFQVFNYKLILKDKIGEKCQVGTINSKAIIEHLRINNILKEKAAHIKFPSILYTAKPSVIFAFISGFFDADGCVKKGKKEYSMVSINRKFLSSIQNVLSSFGIVSKIHSEKRNKINWKTLYKLSINGAKNQSLFADYMSESVKIQNVYFDKKKRDQTQTIYTLNSLDENLPKPSFLVSKNQHISYSSFIRLKNEYKLNTDAFLFHDQVKSIEYMGEEEHDVYDLVLPNEHLFFANGLYAHNSNRRGALLLSLDGSHYEAESFVTSKLDETKITGANISLKLSDYFMEAVEKNQEYTLQWPVKTKDPKFSKKIKALELWNLIVDTAWKSGDPGLFFWDTASKFSPADCYKVINPDFENKTSNPCGEIIMGVDSCRLILMNSMGYVKNAFTKEAFFDWEMFKTDAKKMQRLMDDLIDLELEALDRIIEKINSDPEPLEDKQIELNTWQKFKENCIAGRRTGSGLTGIADTLAALGITYGSQESIKMVESIYKSLAISCYETTVELAKERGAFPLFSYEVEKNNSFLQKIWDADPDLYKKYMNYGRRNIALLTTAPAGTVSLMTQTSSGIEPVFRLAYTRRKKINPDDKESKIDFIDNVGDKWQEFKVYHKGLQDWFSITKETELEKSPYFKATSDEIDWEASVDIQAAAQAWIDHSVSKTINLPENVSRDVVAKVYMRAWKTGCKGITVYREGSKSGVLISDTKETNTIESNASVEEHHAPKRPKELPCDIHHMTVQGEKWVFFIGLLQGRPFEIMGGRADKISLPKRVKNGKIIKHNGEINPAQYSLHYDYEQNSEDETVIKDIGNVFENVTNSAFCRTMSLALRHGVPIQFILEQIVKGSDKESDMFSFSKAASRVLKMYIKDGTKSSGKEKCPDCGSTEIAYKDGCKQCIACGWSKCS